MIQISLQEAMVMYNGHRALGPVTLEAQAGEHIVLVGESGAGKSSLLGLIREQVRENSAWLPQELGLVQTLSAYHNVYMGQLHAYSWFRNLLNLIRPDPKQVAEIQPLLRALDIETCLWKPVGELSGGQKQRVGVARSLFQKAEILLADEPISALDAKRADQVMSILVGAYDTSIIALHDIDLALRYASRIIGIQSGQIVLDEPAKDLQKSDLMGLYQNLPAAS